MSSSGQFGAITSIDGVTPIAGNVGLTSTGHTITITPGVGTINLESAVSGGITTINGDSGSVTGTTITLTGGTSGAIFTGSSTTMTESFHFLTMSATDASQNGTITIGSTLFASLYGTENIFIGGSGNFTLTTSSAVGNIGIGNEAFNILSTGTENTVVGTSSGGNVLDGSLNCVFGAAAAPAMISGTQNTIVGAACGGAVGNGSGSTNNIVIGWGSGGQLAGTEAGNIYLGNPGVDSESGAIRIGKVAGGAGFTAQTTCFIAGIYGNSPSGTAQLVYVDTDGTMSSAAASGGSVASWTDVTGATQSLAINSGYAANRSSLVTFTLPASSAIGSIIVVTGKGTGGWLIAQNSGQQIFFGSASSTVGVSGSISSTLQRDVVYLRCITADTEWQVENAVGNITVS